jgi:3-phosphoshikimate 1-carboxyvinyltransferase
MLDSLQTLGVAISRAQDGATINGGLDLESTTVVELQTRLAGTTSRFLTAVASLRNGATTVDGDASLRTRPMSGLHDALRTLGASVVCSGVDGHLPVTVKRGGSWQNQIAIDSTTSSQFTSALMMIAPYFSKGLEIELRGKVVSRGYLDMTVAVMREFGARTEISGNTIWVAPSAYQGANFLVEPDASSASYPSAAVAIAGGSSIIAGLTRNSSQRDVEFLDVLSNMGCQVRQVESGIQISRDPSVALAGIEVDMSDISDCVPTLAVVAMFANSPTKISGVGFIRTKESNRISDLAGELRKFGAQIVENDDGLTISPAPLHTAKVVTHHDHRLAMAFALVGLKVRDVVIETPEVVSKSWPTYFEDFAKFTKN